MSGRGTITSRTTVSPNSKIEWMSSRSSVSIDASCAATSAIVRISSSVTNGPPRSPFPGMTTLARPIKPRVRTRNGPNRVRNASRGDTRITARSACCTANVLGATSANVNTTMISMTIPTATPALPKVGSRTVPSNVAEIIWLASNTSRTLFSVCSGCSSMRSTRSARLSPSSARFRSRIRLAARTRFPTMRAPPRAQTAPRSPRWQRHDRSHRPQDLCSSSRKRARSSCSRRRITTPSSGSAWS